MISTDEWVSVECEGEDSCEGDDSGEGGDHRESERHKRECP